MYFYLHVCMSTTCMVGACEDQKGALDPLKLEIQKVVNSHLGNENSAQVQPASALNYTSLHFLQSCLLTQASHSLNYLYLNY